LARSKVKAPADLLPILTEQLVAEDPELAGLSARALAKSEGAGDLAAAAIEAAFLSGGSRVAQVDRIRALGAIKSTVAVLALVRAIGPSRADSAVRRTVLEALKGSAFHMADAHSRVLAARQVRAIIRSSDGESPAPADVRAAAVSFLAAFDPDQFRTLLPELRLAAPWKVRAAAAAGLFGQSAVDEGWVKSFLADPDRRVRIAALEAFALKPTPNPNVLESLFERFSATPHHHHIPRTFDPVELSALASAIKAGDPQKAPLFLNGLFGTRAAAGRKIPHHEVEALQSILDLVASTEWDQREATLRQYLHSPEISLRKRAKELLAKKGIDASEHRPHDDQAAARLLDACIARAKRLEDEPVASAVIETSKGDLTIALFRSDAPATVENFLELAKRGFYDGTLWHRVVPAFVAQAGCPRGDGWGGPGYTIRCEVNHRTYRRGSIGMALAGKDTGGSQFFICHRSLPQLDGRYTLFGQVVDGMDVVDSLTEEDWIVRVREP
jgi:cyclophilin family peptidyl-prolyl cis-trans isomerase